jgi:hypothetical protein
MNLSIIKRAALVAAASLAVACASTDDGGDDGGDFSSPEQACLDTADALAGSAQRCGYDYKANFDAFVNSAAQGDCRNIIAVRDKSSLYAECIPYMQGLTCEQVSSGNLNLPASCVDQLLRNP